MWLLYELGFILGFLCYLPRALWRRRLPHAGWTMRLGRYPAGVLEPLRGHRPVWVHAVSVGEVLAARPLLRALSDQRPNEPLILSTITPAGFGVASQQSVGVVPIYFPLDLRACVGRAVSSLQPSCLLLVESELWPNAIRLAAARGVPVAVVNGRLSPRAFARYRLVRPWLRGLWGRVALFLMQSQADADRMLALGALPERVRVTGSLKWDASLSARPIPQEVQQAAGWLGLGAGQPVVAAGSTHRGEETLILRAFRSLRASHPDARLILAPRHLERFAEAERLAQGEGLRVVRVSAGRGGGAWDVALVDAFGQLPLYYALASVVVVGGSFIPHGGQNPLEATSLGKPVVFGPSMHNFEAIAHQLLAHHAARQASGERELTGLLAELVERPDEADRAVSGRHRAHHGRARPPPRSFLNALPD
jgi:3-deoxy-D-manno-octulosonic-acid transferase